MPNQDFSADPSTLKEQFKTYKQNYRDINTNILADAFQRAGDVDIQNFVRNFPNNISDAFAQAKEGNFDSSLNSPWGQHLRQNVSLGNAITAETAKQNVDRLIDQGINTKQILTNPVVQTFSKEKGKQFLDKFRFPDFIAEPLKLRNPVVSSQSGIEPGSKLNAQAAEFIKNFQSTDQQLGRSQTLTEYQSPFGSRVSTMQYEPASVKLKGKATDISFTGPEGFGITAKQSKVFRDPLLSPGLRYTLGKVLEDIPVGEYATASPVGGFSGTRARAYQMLTKGAFTAQQNESGTIQTQKVGPTTWQNVGGTAIKEFDPSTLKDPLIRAVYKMPETQDVSGLRDNPLGLLQRTNRIDFTKPVITTESPVYQFRQGVRETVFPSATRPIPTGAALGLTSALLTPGTPTALAKGQYGTVAQNVGKDVAIGTGTEAGARLAGAGLQRVAPALAGVVNPAVAGLARFAGPAGLTYSGITGTNEFVKAATGEDIPSKLQQFLGTKERTGGANVNRQREVTPNYSIPTITPLTAAQKTNILNRQNENEFQKRLRLAGERFNPSKGEFGLSELLLGR